MKKVAEVVILQQAHGVCIHAHFYQPPREDPWLDAVMKDSTAAPYNDWNECVYEQCYKPNMAARLLDSDGRIVYLTNNYRHISFNVGPTLHSWIAMRDPVLAASIADADRIAAESFGAGGAIAQAYNHMILPLSSARDIRTQVIWGVRDFEFRFGRRPRGMWLPETAVDTASLEALASAGIEFTILAPHQCEAVLEPGGTWKMTPGGSGLDVTRPYTATLPSGAVITIVFYFGSIAHDIAFGGLLYNGDFFAEALLSKLPGGTDPRLLVIATDGETYGHHHHFGEMALARAAQKLSNSPDAVVTNIPSFLDKYPAEWECKVAERTSWSCAHGVERWRGDCGCETGGQPGWRQMWRAPLRDALDKVRDRVDEIYEREMRRFCDSPWELRDEAISLYLMEFGPRASSDDVARAKGALLRDSCGNLSRAHLERVLTLIEAQRMRMFMYTSCGWFFNDIAGIETRQIMAYALRAAEYIGDPSIGDGFINDLKSAPGNTSEMPTGHAVITRSVIPLKRVLRDIAASAALLSKDKAYYAFRIKSDSRHFPSGDFDLRVAGMEIADTRTLETWNGTSAVISTGGLDDVCRLAEKAVPNQKDIWQNFYEGDIMTISKFLEESFEFGSWHFSDVPVNDRDGIASERTKSAEQEHLELAEGLLDDNHRLLVQLRMMEVSSSQFLKAAADFVYEHKLQLMTRDSGDILDLLKLGSKLEILLEDAHSIGIFPVTSVLAPALEKAFHDKLLRASEDRDEPGYAVILELWRRAAGLGINIGKWSLQNKMWDILGGYKADPPAVAIELAGELGFAIPGH
jgi:alpha-amylase/alpha-mannosidase (GH57 family)